jgi:CBS domain-containing protein
VVDDDFRVIGILSDRDVRTAVGDPRRALDKEGRALLRDRFVGSVMTRAPITVEPTTSVVDVAAIFVDERIGAVPVVRDDDTLLGIVSYVDVIAHFVGRRR